MLFFLSFNNGYVLILGEYQGMVACCDLVSILKLKPWQAVRSHLKRFHLRSIRNLQYIPHNWFIWRVYSKFGCVMVQWFFLIYRTLCTELKNSSRELRVNYYTYIHGNVILLTTLISLKKKQITDHFLPGEF